MGGRHFAASIGNVADEMVAEYIEQQSRKAPEDEDQDYHVEDEL